MRKSAFFFSLILPSKLLFGDAVFVTDFDMMGMMGKVSVIDSTINAVIAEVSTTGFSAFKSPYGTLFQQMACASLSQIAPILLSTSSMQQQMPSPIRSLTWLLSIL